MGVLSDSEIRRRIGLGQLVPGGDPALATECSYAFVPGSAFLAGRVDVPIEFPGPEGKAAILVRPGTMIWIRTRDRVAIPVDMAGFWWQTNSLSRKGLMLVNMSMIEPGYEGDLACLFVNFGKSDVLISARTTIAKMTFMELSGRVDNLFLGRADRADYDDRLRELAAAQPTSFLQVGELAADLRDARAEALRDIRAEGVAVKADAAAALAAARADAVKDFNNDVPGVVRRSFAWALGLFALLTTVSVATGWVRGQFVPDVRTIARSEAQDALAQRLTISAGPPPAQAARIEQRMDELNRRLAALEKKS